MGLYPLRRGRQGLRLQDELARGLAHARAPEERAGGDQGRHRVDVLRQPEPLAHRRDSRDVKPDERIVLAAHVQEPGANDDASGCGTLLALAAALAQAIGPRASRRPGRTLTFLWIDEIRGSRQWLASIPSRARACNTCSRST